MSQVEKVKITRRKYLKYGAGVAGAAVLAAAGYGIYEATKLPPTTPTPTPTTTAEKRLVIGTTDVLTWLDVNIASHYLDYFIVSLIYDRLITYSPTKVEFVPQLAKDFPQVSADLKTYTFTLREGITFHTGQVLDAAAVKYTIDRMIRMGKGQAFLLAIVDKIVVVDTYTVQFQLNTPYAPHLLYSLVASAPLGILCPDEAEKWGDEEFNYHPSGSGPFKFDHWVLDSEVVLAKNLNYWDKSRIPLVDKLMWKFYGDPSTLVMALRKGEVDIANRIINPGDVPGLKSDKHITAYETPIPYVRYLVLNHKIPPLDNKLARQAMAYAIDFDDAISTIFKGEATRIFTLVPDAFPESVPAFKRYSYNPTKAKELLAQAGYPNGFDTQLWYSPTHYGATEADIAVKIQSYLKAVGINAELRYAEWATYVASWKNGMFPMFFYGWTPNLYEADDYVRPFMESNSYLAGPTGYASATADELLSQVAVETDPAKVRDLYAKLQELMAEDLPELVGWMPKDYAFVRDNVKGFQWCPVFSATDLTRVTVD